MKVGVRDISRKTGFSPATVSNALNHKRGVSKETAEAILRVAQELGYQRPNRLDRIQFVVVRKSGKVLDESDFHPAVVDGVEREAKLHGLTTSYVTIDLADPGAHSQLRELCQDTTSGIVLLGTEMMEEDYEPFYGSAAPLVIVDGWCYHSFIESIVISNESSAYRAVHYLIGKGHTRIGYVRGNPVIRNFPLRERGCRRALEEAGLSWNDDYCVTVGTSLSTAYAAAKEWLEGDPELPTAFFAENDVMACGMMRALLERGVKVPEEVSFVGFDDLPVATVMLPALTTLHVPKHDIGAMAVQKLIAQVKAPRGFTCTTHVSTTFVERDSVAQL